MQQTTLMRIKSNLETLRDLSITERCPSVDHWQTRTRKPGLELSKPENPNLEKTAGLQTLLLKSFMQKWGLSSICLVIILKLT